LTAVKVYIPSLKESVSIVIDAKVDTNDVHVICTDIQEDVSTIFWSARKRVTIENSYKDAKQLGFGEYRYRKNEGRLYDLKSLIKGWKTIYVIYIGIVVRVNDVDLN
jgi:hypothetical protein